MKKKKASPIKHLKTVSLVICSIVALGILSYAIAKQMHASTAGFTPCANSKSCLSNLSDDIENGVSGYFLGKPVTPPIINLAQEIAPPVLGVSTPSERGEKHIYVDLSKQTLIAFEGSTQILKTLVSTGKWGRTPPGNFHVWTKLRSTRMSGGEGSDAYDLPNVQYVMFFYHDFGLHTAYWHNNFGHEMSHGCVNLRLVDAKALYEWADGPSKGVKGTPVSVCNEFSEDNQCIQTNPLSS